MLQGVHRIVFLGDSITQGGIRADGSLLNAPDPAKPTRSALPTLAAGSPALTPIAPAARPASPRAPTAAEAKRRVASPEPNLKPSLSQARTQLETRPEAAAAEPAASGDWAVQLAGEPTEADARTAATSFAAKFGSALQGRHPTFVSAQVGERPSTGSASAV